MVDTDLATLYGVPTSALNQAVTRNAERFPKDFAFKLSPKEWAALKSHFVTSKTGRVAPPPEPTKTPIGFIHTKDEWYVQ